MRFLAFRNRCSDRKCISLFNSPNRNKVEMHMRRGFVHVDYRRYYVYSSVFFLKELGTVRKEIVLR